MARPSRIKRTILASTSVLALLIATPIVLPDSTPAAAQTNVVISVEFRTALTPYGTWRSVPRLGDVWIPARVSRDWQPYTVGHWVYSGDFGWYWISDDEEAEWGWVAFHYGRWAYVDSIGWAWVPGNEWGPAWVDWRYSDDYVGWAPMPPEYRWRNGTFVGASVDLAAPQYSSNWVFVSNGDFARGNVRAHRVSPARNREMLTASVRVTNYAAVNGRVVNRSIDRAKIGARTKVRIDPVNVGLASSIGERLRIRAAGSIPVYKPRVVEKSNFKLDTTVEDRFDARGAVDTGASATQGVARDIDAGAGASARGTIDRSIGGGLGGGVGIGGVGIGGGGGLRIGR